QNNEVEIYVAPNGNDEWTGKLSEPNMDKSDGPLATLNAARIKVREQITNGLPGAITIWIRGGEYVLDSTIIFGPEDSGTKEFPVYYQAFPNEIPVFTGGKKLVNWRKCENEPGGISEKAKGNLWYHEIPEDLKGDWQITTLYNGKKLLSRSRSGKFKASKEQVLDPYNAQPKDVRGVEWDDEPLVFSREFRYSGDDLKDWKNPSDIEILLSPKHGWLINMLPLERINVKTKTAFFAIDATYGIRPESDYFVENAIEYLDEPGEWCYNSREGRIYIWPENSLDKVDIRAPFLQEFIRVEGIEDKSPVRFLHFKGLTFRHGLRDTWKPGDKGLQHDWEMYDKGTALIRFRHAEECSVVDCTFEASGGSGIRLDLYAQRIKVADCVLAHLGGTGILLSGYGPGLKDENKFNTVTNNYIHHVGTIYKHSPGIFIAQSGHNLISHNTIHDLAYDGMVISGCRPHELVLAKPLQNRREWVSSIRVDEIGPYIKDITPEMLDNWLEFDVSMIEPLLHARENQIEYNEIYRVMLELHDGNGIYFSGMGKNNRAVKNYFQDIHTSRGYIRLDDISGYTIITHNVGVRGARMMQIKGPGEIRNNFAFDTKLFIARRWCPTKIDNFILYNTPQGEGHFNQYNRFPEVNMIYEFFDRVSNSLIYVENPPEEMKLGQDVIAPDKRGDADVGMLFADPMFDEEAMKKRIFRFKPGSPAPDLGIEPIDLSSAGSTLAK
ncbi:MAG TPA: right-handed parallel beta-helix repeat-containing protein, partial [Prolixibacteraceae bacterium]|nr:right-handed parallel beta-helix repeat-containing protein [Prolixibacteraceae bacterium]